MVYLGHEVSHRNIAPLHSYMDELKEMTVPTTKKMTERLCGAFNWVAKFIPRLQLRIGCWYGALKSKPFEFNEECKATLAQLQQELGDLPKLTTIDPEQPEAIWSSVSQQVAVLAQRSVLLVK